jgi:hypothetical protein
VRVAHRRRRPDRPHPRPRCEFVSVDSGLSTQAIAADTIASPIGVEGEQV